MPKARLFRCRENCTAIFTATLRDETGTVIPLVDLFTLTLSLYRKDWPTEYIRDHQDAKNANNVTVHATSGLITWSIQPEDNVFSSANLTADKESHIALFEWSWNGGESNDKAEYEIQVERVVNRNTA